MTKPNECVGLKKHFGHKCSCGAQMPLQVCKSNTGYYLGYICPNCGPYSRETDYYKTREEAQQDLDDKPTKRIRL